ncbi:MAG: hypothetical protein ABJQ90_16320, partial [Parasphingorhabdus sp.]
CILLWVSVEHAAILSTRSGSARHIVKVLFEVSSKYVLTVQTADKRELPRHCCEPETVVKYAAASG